MSGYPIDLRLKHSTLNAFKADKIPVDTTYFDNTGPLVTPKDVITQQGNTFNGASQLVKLGSDGKLPAIDASNVTNVTAQNMSPYTPYSVTSAKTSSGYASYITKTSNTQIDFDTNSGSTPIKICYPDGNVESNTTLSSITGISTDGTYYIVKEKGGNPYITTLQPVESIVAPSSPSNNQLWLDLSVIPYIPKKWNGTSWVNTQFVRLGEFVRTSGVIGTPISYALNGIYQATLSVSPGQTYTINHNLGTSNRISTYLVSTTQDNFIPAQSIYWDGVESIGYTEGWVASSDYRNISKLTLPQYIGRYAGGIISSSGYYKIIYKRSF